MYKRRSKIEAPKTAGSQIPIILSGNKPNTKNHGKQQHSPRALKIPACLNLSHPHIPFSSCLKTFWFQKDF